MIYFLVGVVIGAIGLLYLHVRNQKKIDDLSTRLEEAIKKFQSKGE